jgi:hypothetical protein
MLTLAVLLGTVAVVGDGVPMSWRGRRFDSAQFPEGMPDRVRAAVDLWSPWATKAGYRFDCDDEGRVLLATRRTGGKGDAQLRIVKRAEGWYDGLFPITASDETPAALMLVLRDEKAHAEALTFVGKIAPELAGWAGKAAGKELGFVLGEPLCGAFVEAALGLKEWNPDHELLPRTVQVLLLRRHGALPHWLAQGLAWEAERTLLGSIWCFPHRSGFVAKTEHEAWPGELAKELANEALTVFSVEALANWRRGTYDGESARHAWGIAHYLAREKADVLDDALGDLRAFREAKGRTTHEDGSWELVPGYEIPAAAQAEILAKRFGESWIAEARAWSLRNAAVR